MLCLPVRVEGLSGSTSISDETKCYIHHSIVREMAVEDSLKGLNSQDLKQTAGNLVGEPYCNLFSSLYQFTSAHEQQTE